MLVADELYVLCDIGIVLKAFRTKSVIKESCDVNTLQPSKDKHMGQRQWPRLVVSRKRANR